MKTLAIQEMKEGAVFDFGPETLSKTEIADFAKVADPQPIHIDEAAAKKSPFGAIIASGLHPFVRFNKTYWVPMCAEHFICGLGMSEVRFFKPAYAEEPLTAKLRIISLEPKPSKGTMVATWRLDIYKDGGETQVCTVSFASYHYMDETLKPS